MFVNLSTKLEISPESGACVAVSTGLSFESEPEGSSLRVEDKATSSSSSSLSDLGVEDLSGSAEQFDPELTAEGLTVEDLRAEGLSEVERVKLRPAPSGAGLRSRRGLSVVELVVAVGLVFILAGVSFWAIDPIERQKQARDQKRLENLDALQVAIETEVKAGTSLGSTFGVPSGTAGAEISFKPDGSGWVPMNLSRHFSFLPADPRNGTNFVDSLASKIFGEYQFISDGSYYVLRAHLEAEVNREKYAQDGSDNTWYEVGTAPGMSTYFGL